ncbi:MAG TPA: DUF6011 domain-containing protein [Bacteroidales bacterium]|nr:DUF6011 domain-containing protein [Bacteroidales bacterium]
MDANITFTGRRKDIDEIQKDLVIQVKEIEKKYPEAKLEKLETKTYVKCQRCGKTLTRPESISNGWGAICMKKKFQIFF